MRRPANAAALPRALVTVLAGLALAFTARPGLADQPGSASQVAAIAADLFGLSEAPRALRSEEPVPGWTVETAGGVAGYIGSTREIAGSIGYSGQPIDILVGVAPDARIAGARLIRQNEPILMLGISPEDLARFVSGFAGVDLTKSYAFEPAARSGVPDIISRATVSTGVMRDAILQTGRALALAHGLIGGAAIDRVNFREMSWQQLAAIGALAHGAVSMAEAHEGLAAAKYPPPAVDASFLDLWVAVVDPPTIGRNLLGQRAWSEVVAALGPGQSALLLASRGRFSHRGREWRRSGEFDRLVIRQGGETMRPRAEDFTEISGLAAEGAPDFPEISVFRMPAGRFDPTRPFRVEVTASRPAEEGVATTTVPVDYTLPRRFVLARTGTAVAEPIWMANWRNRRVEIVGVALMLTVLAGILFFQEAFVRRPKLWRGGRIAFLSVTLVWLGWVAGGQLSVVQVIAFVHSLLEGFHWETFLIEPVIFLLWSFVALGLLFWGRGVYCGWLCPFGALQEITNEIAQRLRVPQVNVPFGLHERLWVIKYTLFVALLALSFYSMERALIGAEVEPFKTAITMRFLRAWPFVLFVLALLVVGLFIERFYCRYLCPLGAGLAIPAKLKLFDWLRRRPQCGRECRLCEQKCTVGAIDPIGRINPNECILCLRCQMIYHDPQTCIVLKRRRGRSAPSLAAAESGSDVKAGAGGA